MDINIRYTYENQHNIAYLLKRQGKLRYYEPIVNYFLSKTFQILQNSNAMYKIYRIKMLPSVKYDGTPKHDKMCS